MTREVFVTDAVSLGARSILSGECEIIVAGVTDSMTKAPFVMKNPDATPVKLKILLPAFDDGTGATGSITVSRTSKFSSYRKIRMTDYILV